MDLIIQVRDNEAPFIMELLKKFDFVKVKQADYNAPILESLELSLNQMKAMKDGKLAKPSITELFEND